MPPEIEFGKTYNPLAIVANADEALAYRSAQSRTQAENQELARRLFSDLSRANDQAGEQGDFSRVTGFGDNPAERVMQIHSQLAGIERAIFEEVQAEVQRQQRESAVLRNVGGGPLPQLDGDGRPIMPRTSMNPAQRFMAAANATERTLRDLAGINWEHVEEFLGDDATLASEQIRRALFGSMGIRAVVPASFNTGDWDPWFNREPGYVPAITRPLQIIDLIPMGSTMTDTVAWIEETTNAPNAREVLEGGLIPEANYALTQRTTPVYRVAHRISVTENVLNDVGQTSSYLNLMLPFGVMQRLDDQILNGDGSNSTVGGEDSETITGILANTNALNHVLPDDDGDKDVLVKPIHEIKKALTAYRTHNEAWGRRVGSDMGAMPTHILMHPDFWEQCCLAETTAGGFYLGNPANSFEPRLWGVPIVETTRMPNAVNMPLGLIADFTGMWITLYIREGLSTQMGLIGDQFGRYMVTLRSGIRCALAIRRGAAFMKLTRSA